MRTRQQHAIHATLLRASALPTDVRTLVYEYALDLRYVPQTKTHYKRVLSELSRYVYVYYSSYTSFFTGEHCRSYNYCRFHKRYLFIRFCELCGCYLPRIDYPATIVCQCSGA